MNVGFLLALRTLFFFFSFPLRTALRPMQPRRSCPFCCTRSQRPSNRLVTAKTCPRNRCPRSGHLLFVFALVE